MKNDVRVFMKVNSDYLCQQGQASDATTAFQAIGWSSTSSLALYPTPNILLHQGQHPILSRTHRVVEEFRISDVRSAGRWERLLLAPINEWEQRFARFHEDVQPCIWKDKGAYIRAATG